ncbi:MAG TPA: hypothetical protein VIZ68_07460, partial [Thermoplasmata archaeon]
MALLRGVHFPSLAAVAAGWLVLLTAIVPVAGSGAGAPGIPAPGAVHPSASPAVVAISPAAPGLPFVESTIVLSNRTVVSGNALPGDGNRPYAVAYSDPHRLIYIGSWGTDFLTVVDAANHTLVGYVPVNTTGVTDLLVAGDLLYVCGFNQNLVQVVNTTQGRVVANISIGTSPAALAWDPVHDRVLVTVATRPWFLYAISNQNFTVVGSQVIRNSPGVVVYDPIDNRIFVGDGGSNVNVLDGTTLGYITNLTMGFDPWSGIWDPANDLLYMAAQESDNVTIIDPAADVVIGKVQIGGEPSATALDPSGRWLYVASGERNNVTRIDTSDPTQHFSIPTGPHPVGLAYDAATGEGVTANFIGNNLTFFNGSTGALDFTVANGFTPQGMAYDPATDEVYISESSEGTVFVWNVTQGRLSDAIPVPGSPTQLVYDGATGRVLVLRSYAGLVSEIDDRTHAIVASFPVVPGSIAMAADPTDDRLYVADAAGGGIQGFRLSTGAATTVINATLPNALQYCPRTGLVYAVVGYLDDQVMAIDPTQDRPVVNGSAGLIGTSILCDPFADRLYVTNQRTQNVSVLNATSLVGVGSLLVGAGGQGADYDLLNAELSVSDSYDNTISVLGALNQSLVATLAVGVSPGTVVYVPTLDAVFVANVGSGTVSIVEPGSPPPTLQTLTISPTVLSILEGVSAPVVAHPTSNYGIPLISGVNYSWSVSPTTLGTAIDNGPGQANFTAGGATGFGYLSVNATYRGLSLRASIPVQVLGPP